MTSSSDSDSTPREYDVGLFLCGGAIRMLASTWAEHPEQASEVYRWYSRKIAFQHLEDASLQTVREVLRVRLQEEAAQLPLHHDLTAPLSAPPLCPRDEVDFAVALDAVGGGGGGAGLSVEGTAEAVPLDEDGSWAGAAGAAHIFFDVEESAWVGAGGTRRASPSPGRVLPCDDGFALVVQFLFLCLTVSATDQLAEDACVAIVELIDRQRVGPLASGNAGFKQSSSPAVDTATLDLCFALDNEAEPDALAALGSLTKSFHVVVALAWSCASFHQQARLASAVSGWVRGLAFFAQHPTELTQVLGAYGKALEEENHRGGTEDAGNTANLTELYELLRVVFEGHLEQALARDGGADNADTDASVITGSPDVVNRGTEASHTALMKLSAFFSLSRPVPLSDHSVTRLLTALETIGAPRADRYNVGTLPILQSITAGMLLYVQLYLSLRSLHLAEQCSSMALLVSHQLHSNAALALAHYNAFLVHVARGSPAEAADSIAVALQLSTASPASSADGSEQVNGGEGTGGALGYSMRSLCFAGAAQLLLFYPSAVGTSLRAALTSDYAARAASSGAPSYRLILGNDNAAAAYPEGGEAAATPADEAAAGPTAPDSAAAPGPSATARQGPRQGGSGHAVVVQSIAQTVRNVLWLSEATAFVEGDPADSTPRAWPSLVASLQRETLLVVASLYGVRSSPRQLNHHGIAALLLQVGEDESAWFEGSDAAATNSTAAVAMLSPLPRQPVSARDVLLSELLRHTAHKVLAVNSGCLTVACDCPASGSATPMTGSANGCAAALRVASEFIAAVESHYGPRGCAAVEQHVAFSSTVQFVALSAMHRAGYAAAAYDGLTGLALRLYRVSGMSPATVETSGADSFSADHGQRVRASYNPYHIGNEAHSETCDEEECVLRYLQDSVSWSPHVLSSAKQRRDALASGHAAASPGSRLDASGGVPHRFFWPPDQLLLYANVQMKRAEIASFLGFVEALDTIRAVLNLVCARCGFVHGVLASRYVELLCLQARLNVTAAEDAATELVRSADAIGLVALSTPARMRKVSVLSSAGRWTAALSELDVLSTRVPSDHLPWYLVSRLTVGYEALLVALDSAGRGGDARRGNALLDSYVEEALSALMKQGFLSDDGKANDSLPLTDAIAIQATVARLKGGAPPTSASGSAVEVLHDLAGKLAARQFARDGARCLFSMPLMQLCSRVSSTAFELC